MHCVDNVAPIPPGFASVYRDLLGAQPIPFDRALRRERFPRAFELLGPRIARYENT